MQNVEENCFCYRVFIMEQKRISRELNKAEDFFNNPTGAPIVAF